MLLYNKSKVYNRKSTYRISGIFRVDLIFAEFTTSLNYCKRGYFRWGKISREFLQDLSRGGNFHDISPISFIKSYGFYFPVGEIFAKKVISRKTRKLPPRENFHVYSSQKSTQRKINPTIRLH